MYLSIVIPCFNEERNLRLGTLEKVAHFMGKKDFSYEVLLVDDGSTDDSKKLIKNFIADNQHFSLIECHHHGKASTVMTGMLRSKGDFVLFTDLDQATPISEIDSLLPWTKKGYDIVIGSRNTRRKGAPLLRLAMARGFMLLRNIILSLNINDTQCGFKLFTKKTISPIFSKLKIYKGNEKVSGSTVTAGFDVEVLYIAQKLGFKIKEVPVEWYYQETRRVNPIQDSLLGLKDLLKIRLNSLKGIY